jgi:SAM-dependent methyltransferase
MTAGEAPPQIFDRALRRQRAARWAHLFAQHDVLHRHAAMLACEALLDVTRRFERALIWGDRGQHIAALLPPGKVGQVFHARPQDESEASPYANGAFDLVISLLDLHACNDPVGALVQMRAALEPDGLMLAVMFGGPTLHELRDVMAGAEIEQGGLSPRVFPFADVRDCGGLLQRAGFALPVADADTLTIRYADPLKLLGDLRGSGESNVLAARRRMPLRRRVLMRALELYAERHIDGDGKYRATFQFITLTGWAPHASQQQPLKPGTATKKLSEALDAIAADRSKG